MTKIPGLVLLIIRRVIRWILMMILRPHFKSIGKNVWFDPYGDYSFETITIADNVFIGSGARIAASNSSVSIGNKVMFGPDVCIMGGDHNTSVVGRYMFDVKDKQKGDDLPISIEDDVWIGARVTILKGVTIGTGSVVAAGSVVTKSAPASTFSLRYRRSSSIDLQDM